MPLSSRRILLIVRILGAAVKLWRVERVVGVLFQSALVDVWHSSALPGG